MKIKGTNIPVFHCSGQLLVCMATLKSFVSDSARTLHASISTLGEILSWRILSILVHGFQSAHNFFHVKVVKFNPFPSKWVLRALIDFTLSNARRFYSSMGNLLDRKGLKCTLFVMATFNIRCTLSWSVSSSSVSDNECGSPISLLTLVK